MSQTIPNADIFNSILRLHMEGQTEEAHALHDQWKQMNPLGLYRTWESTPVFSPVSDDLFNKHRNPAPTFPKPRTHDVTYLDGEAGAARLIAFLTDYDFTATRTDEDGINEAHLAWKHHVLDDPKAWRLRDYADYNPAPELQTMPQPLLRIYLGHQSRVLYTYKNGLYLTDTPVNGADMDDMPWIAPTSEPADPQLWLSTPYHSHTTGLPGADLYDSYREQRHSLAEEWATQHIILNNPDNALEGHQAVGAELIWQEAKETTYEHPSLAQYWRDTATGHVYLRHIDIDNSDPDQPEALTQWMMEGLASIISRGSIALFPYGKNPHTHPELYREFPAIPRSEWRFQHLIKELNQP